MEKGNSLVRFLFDFPWTSGSNLESIFGTSFRRLAKSKETRSVTVSGVGECWSVANEKLSSLPGVRRRESAKEYVVDQYGPDALWTGGSPGLWGSDTLALVGKNSKYWVRVWVDFEGASVEAFPFINPGPSRIAPNMIDLVITMSDRRAELIKVQTKSKWPKGQRPAIIFYNKRSGVIVSEIPGSLSGSGPSSSPLSSSEVTKLLSKQRWKRLQNIRSENAVGRFFLDLSQVDLDFMKYIGDNPLFDLDGLSILVSSSITGIDFHEVKRAALNRLGRLDDLGLIESAAPPLPYTKLSSQGLQVLSKYWGISPHLLIKYHSWPQKISSAGKHIYSEAALSRIKVHTREMQSFVFGLLDNAWRLHEKHGGVDVCLETIIGGRLQYKDLASGKYAWVIPDAVIEMTFWRKIWRNGHVHDKKNEFSQSQVFLEIDRATNPITRLPDRIKHYGRIWRSLPGNPALVWVIYGTPWREKEILEMMGAAGIAGWTVLAERLILTKEDPWWERFSHKEGVLPHKRHNGHAPLRKIWRKVGDYDMHHFLDHSPWEKEMSLSKKVVRVPRSY